MSENPDNPVLVPHPLDLPPIPAEVVAAIKADDYWGNVGELEHNLAVTWPHLYRLALRHAAARMDAQRNGNEETWFSVFGDTLRDWADNA